MPRIKPQLLRYAASISRDLANLLPACRDLPTASNELRWIREHVQQQRRRQSDASSCSEEEEEDRRRRRVSRLCYRRGRLGEPLQYVLGSQPFGGGIMWGSSNMLPPPRGGSSLPPLDLLCRPGVLIPRNDTEAWVSFLLQKEVLWGREEEEEEERWEERRRRRRKIRIVDFCTGTGCVGLFLAQGLIAGRANMLKKRKGEEDEVGYTDIQVYGFDVSDKAVALARDNLTRNREAVGMKGEEEGEDAAQPGEGNLVRFEKGDIFSDEWVDFLREGGVTPEIDVLVANPPYISEEGFGSITASSVRKFEPRLALVPGNFTESLCAGSDCRAEDVFYARLLDLARDLLRPRIVVFEVGDMEQAIRVATMAGEQKSGDDGMSIWSAMEIWRDDPESMPDEEEAKSLGIAGRTISIKGRGDGRAVFLRRED